MSSSNDFWYSSEEKTDCNIFFSREEGVLTLWRGATPTIARAIVVNAAQLGTYSQAKESAKKALNMSEGIPLHFMAAMISGLVTTIASMPVDIVKTRLQNQKVSFTPL